MGLVIRFPASLDAYPAQRSSLEDAEGVLLIGLRWWVEDRRRDQSPLPRLRHGMTAAGAPDAAVATDALMSIATRTARRSLEVHGPCCDCLSLPETQMLYAASLVQSGDSARAEHVLRTALLSAQGADMALGPLQAIGRLFSAARLLLRRRQSPVMPTSGSAETLH
jgi:hypothetical protein